MWDFAMNLGLLFLQAELATLTLYDSPKWKYHTGNIQNKDVTQKSMKQVWIFVNALN